MKMARGPKTSKPLAPLSASTILLLAAAVEENSSLVFKPKAVRLDFRFKTEAYSRKMQRLLGTGTVDGTRLSITNFDNILSILTVTAKHTDNHERMSNILHYLIKNRTSDFEAKHHDRLIEAFLANDFKVTDSKPNHPLLITKDSALITPLP